MNQAETEAEAFKAYIATLEKLKPKTRLNYRTYVNWLAKHSDLDFIQDIDLPESRVTEIALSFNPPNIIINDRRRSDVRSILRLYRKYKGETVIEAHKERLPQNSDEGRKRILVSIAMRRGQPRFRRELLLRYGGCCVVTGADFVSVLEAAHIVPFSNSGTDHVSNGLLLRSDIHVLFDLFELSIDPQTKKVYCSEALRKNKTYSDLHGKACHRIPADSMSALASHYNNTKRG